MIIQFSVRNFRTFKEKATLSLVASNYDKEREAENISVDNRFNLRLLKSAVAYGANASGKSKFIDALAFMRNFTISSSRESQQGDKIPVEPFKLNTESENAPSEFEVIFIHKDIMYRYGFEVDTEKVVSEWLYTKPKTKEVELYYRDFQQFDVHERSFSKGNVLVKEKLVRNNALLLSVAAQFNEENSLNVIEWFRNTEIISGLKETEFRNNSISKVKMSAGKSELLDYLKKADLGIVDLEITEVKGGQFENNPFDSVLTIRDKFNDTSKSGKMYMSLAQDESEGTRKYFYLLGPIIDALNKGSVLVVDELDSKLHANLVEKIVLLFNSKSLNPLNAQLLFNTHDTNLLNTGTFRRDQIWFTEKDRYGEARLFSLADFKTDSVRKTEAFEDNYVRGKYGGVPYLDLFENAPSYAMNEPTVEYEPPLKVPVDGTDGLTNNVLNKSAGEYEK